MMLMFASVRNPSFIRPHITHKLAYSNTFCFLGVDFVMLDQCILATACLMFKKVALGYNYNVAAFTELLY